MKRSKKGEGEAIPCICGGGWVRHHVIASEPMGVWLQQQLMGLGNYHGSICTRAFAVQYIAILLSFQFCAALKIHKSFSMLYMSKQAQL